MSDSMTRLVKALAASNADEPRGARLMRRLAVGFNAFVILFFLSAVGFAIDLLWSAWSTGSWDNYYYLMLSVTLALLLPWRLRELRVEARRNAVIREGAQAMHLIAARADAPLAAPQPAPLAADPSTGPLRIRLAQPHPILTGIVMGMLALLGVMGVGMMALAAYVAFIVAKPPDHQQYDWGQIAGGIFLVVILLGVGAALVWVMAWLMTGERSILRNGRYALDDWGLRRRGEARRELTIAWHDVRSFYLAQHVRGLDDDPRAKATMRAYAIKEPDINFVLDAGEHVLTWTVSPDEKPANAAAYERLFGAIAAHIRLPLRDLSEQAAAVLKAAEAAERGEPIPALPGNASADAALARLPRARPALRKRWKRALVVAPLVAILFFWGGGWSLQQIQRAIYGGLPARIHANAPLFADSLAADDGLWPIQPASSDDAAYGFADGAYRISGGGGWATVDRTFGDAAVEVTVRQRWTDPNLRMGDLGQIGLTLRATGNLKSAVTFTIGPLGDWALLRYRDWGLDAGQWQVLADGQHSSAVHQGFQNNRLLVLMRGGEYVCFINAQLVAIAHDDALPAGKAGFWLEDKTTDGYYSNFVVYPAV